MTDPKARITGSLNPDTGQEYTREEALATVTTNLNATAEFVADGHAHFTEHGDLMHILAGLAALHDATHLLSGQIGAILEHDQAQQAIDEQVVEVIVPDVVPAEWTA